MRQLLGLLLAGALFAGACKTAALVQRDDGRGAPAPGQWVEVKKGDTLWALARGHGVSVEEVADVNGIDPAAPILPGQRLFLPFSDGKIPAKPKQPLARAPPTATLADLGWPLEHGVLLRDFSTAGALPHEGLLLAAPAGTPVLAAARGEVLFVGDEGNSFGTLVILSHGPDLLTVYAHLAAPAVQKGAQVTKGQVLGHVGMTGRAESPQLHFQVRSGRTPVDPLAHLPPP
jgi:murein DD-endopeptidase MepM/ murein hydrolase activator NlpD